MPVAGVAGREGPRNRRTSALGNVGGLGNIARIVVVDKLETNRLTEDQQDRQQQKTANDRIPQRDFAKTDDGPRFLGSAPQPGFASSRVFGGCDPIGCLGTRRRLYLDFTPVVAQYYLPWYATMGVLVEVVGTKPAGRLSMWHWHIWLSRNA